MKAKVSQTSMIWMKFRTLCLISDKKQLKTEGGVWIVVIIYPEEHSALTAETFTAESP